jgi:ppGpp synthetase/RelA/SpoT-type nucleotidyltranferase
MSFVVPVYSKGQINRAGDILAEKIEHSEAEWDWANEVLANWRGCHGYPMNTFQATLRMKLKTIDRDAIVAQRLKRAPSIVTKLQRFENMKLARMQDIGGLRAVVSTVARVRKLHTAYAETKFKHELISVKDYIAQPKTDGYRSIHVIYRYSNDRAPQYNGLSLELQMRTKLQHAWATSVETMGTFLGQALKSGRGEDDWKKFFAVAGAALAVSEKTQPVPGFESCTQDELFAKVAAAEAKLRVLEKLSGFAVAADKITTVRGQGAYHLIVLNSSTRTLKIIPYPISRLDEANQEYAKIEARTKAGESIEAVLVSAGPIDALRKAYPNYFLDTQAFIKEITRVILAAKVDSKKKS